MAIDPVCGMEVDEKSAVHTTVFEAETYYFRAPGCKRAFEQDPHNYIDHAPPPTGHPHHA